jgi:hypothetical protein
MSQTVFVLGAGASRDAGGPLMFDFLDIAERLMRSDEVGDAKASFELVFKGIAALQAVHSKSTLDLDNIESVFAAFEMASLFGRLGRSTEYDIAAFSPAIRRMIVRTLERTVRLRSAGTTEGPRVVPPECYDNFAVLLTESPALSDGRVSVLTFNYDLGLDHGLYWKRATVDYCLGEPERGAIPVMKLHGSINWARCPRCNSVVPWTLPHYFANRSWGLYEPGSRLVLNLASQLGEFTHCDGPVSSDPVIVPPTWSKTEHYRELARVWQQAAKHLSEAENIFCIGYSLPDSDHFFRYLYGLGTVGDTRLKRFWVYDPDRTGSVAERYKAMLGQAAKGRFEYHEVPFSFAIQRIRDELGRTR